MSNTPPRYARHYVLSSGPDSSLPRPLCHQPSPNSSRRLSPIALTPRQAEVSQLLHLPALLQGAGERSSLGRARGEARRGTATEKRGAGSDNRTAKRAQQGPQGDHKTSIRPLISRVSKCATFAGCQHRLRQSNGEDGTTGLSGSLQDLHPAPDLSALEVSHFCWLPTPVLYQIQVALCEQALVDRAIFYTLLEVRGRPSSTDGPTTASGLTDPWATGRERQRQSRPLTWPP